jgi:hypothetical protein
MTYSQADVDALEDAVIDAYEKQHAEEHTLHTREAIDEEENYEAILTDTVVTIISAHDCLAPMAKVYLETRQSIYEHGQELQPAELLKIMRDLTTLGEQLVAALERSPTEEDKPACHRTGDREPWQIEMERIAADRQNEY